MLLARGASRRPSTTSLWNPAFTVPALSIAGRRGSFLARPALLQAGASRWRGGLAPGLLVLDAHAADVAPHLLDRARRQHADNGCLCYVPGSHRWRLLPITGLAGDMNEIMTVLDEEQKAAFQPVPVELKRGYCSFHHPLPRARFVREPQRPAAARDRDQRVPRRCALDEQRAAAGGRAADRLRANAWAAHSSRCSSTASSSKHTAGLLRRLRWRQVGDSSLFLGTHTLIMGIVTSASTVFRPPDRPLPQGHRPSRRKALVPGGGPA